MRMGTNESTPHAAWGVAHGRGMREKQPKMMSKPLYRVHNADPLWLWLELRPLGVPVRSSRRGGGASSGGDGPTGREGQLKR